jgi:hypothetical protein
MLLRQREVKMLQEKLSRKKRTAAAAETVYEELRNIEVDILPHQNMDASELNNITRRRAAARLEDCDRAETPDRKKERREKAAARAKECSGARNCLKNKGRRRLEPRESEEGAGTGSITGSNTACDRYSESRDSE